MSNRILRDWTDSVPINELSWQAEVMFTRLIMKADDYGRFDANPKLLRSLLFPLRDGVREADISRWLAECEKAGLIRLYTVIKPLLEIQNFGQRLQIKKSKYEAPIEGDATVTHGIQPCSTVTHGESPPETKRNETKRNEVETKKKNTPSPEGSESERIYAAYPRKMAKIAAIKAIEKALKVMPFEHLFSKVKSYAEAMTGADINFVPYPATWFNRGSYQDDPKAWRAAEYDGKRGNVPPSQRDYVKGWE